MLFTYPKRMQKHKHILNIIKLSFTSFPLFPHRVNFHVSGRKSYAEWLEPTMVTSPAVTVNDKSPGLLISAISTMVHWISIQYNHHRYIL